MHRRHEPRPRAALTAALLLSAVGILSARSDAQDVPPAPPEAPPQEPPPQQPQDVPPAPPPAPPQQVPPEQAPPQEPPKDAPVPPAQDPNAPQAPADPAPPAVVADAPTDDEDAAARKILVAAAERQGGATLAPPDGKLQSFRVVFHKVTVHRVRQNADGTYKRQRMDSEEPGLIIHWKDGQIRTEWHLSGETPVIRGVMFRTKPDGTTADFPWLFDGEATKSLLNPGYEKDREEIERDRRIVRALLQVAVIRSMLADGSRWKVVEDTAFTGTALRRTPPAGVETPLRLTLWVDPKSADVTAAKLAPNEPGESTMYYGLDYNADFPKVKDGVLRFPFRFKVREQRIVEQEPVDVMEATASEASFNDVADGDFRPPKPKKP